MKRWEKHLNRAIADEDDWLLILLLSIVLKKHMEKNENRKSA